MKFAKNKQTKKPNYISKEKGEEKKFAETKRVDRSCVLTKEQKQKQNKTMWSDECVNWHDCGNHFTRDIYILHIHKIIILYTLNIYSFVSYISQFLKKKVWQKLFKINK